MTMKHRSLAILLGFFLSAPRVLGDDSDKQQDVPEQDCGLWMGPSVIKEKEEHGFGFGLFTGRFIPKDTEMHSEVLIPIYDYDDDEHPPLREYLWSADPLRKIVLESLDGSFLFVPGLASIAPCTSVNYNLEQVHNAKYNDWNLHRSKNHSAGAFSYWSNSMFTAIRDIHPGEELVVECADDDYDAAGYPRQTYNAHGDDNICLDDKLEERPSDVHGKGLFAKRNLQPNEILISTPMTPIHRAELVMEDNEIQLLLNYCYGHPDSALLWLPHGPLVNAINHSPTNKNANARIQWHASGDTISGELARRQQYHHPELLQAVAEDVANVHGKGLVMDIVATREIAPNEEILIDYGDAWEEAWQEHKKRWHKAEWDPDHVTAMSYNLQHGNDEVRTFLEEHKNPYPHNLQTACYFETDWVEDEDSLTDIVTFESWNNQEAPRYCLLPCVIMERHKDDDDEGASGKTLYTTKLVDTHQDNVSIDWDCHIYRKFEYMYEDVPREGITFIEKPYTSDVWLPRAFRRAIGVPEEMYPDVWRKRNFRRRSSASMSEDGEVFKRKTVTMKQDTRDALRLKSNPSARMDL